MAVRTRSRAGRPIATRPAPDGDAASRDRGMVRDQPASGFRRVLRGSVALCAVLVAGGMGFAAVVRRRGPRRDGSS